MNHYSKIEPAFIDADIGNISHPGSVRLANCELLLQLIRGDCCGLARDMTGTAVTAQGSDLSLVHGARNPLHTTAYAGLSQIPVDAGTAIDAITVIMELPDFNQQFLIFKGALRHRGRFPCIVATAIYLEYMAHAADPELRLVLVDERVLHSGRLAKYTAAFFSMSRSSVARFSALLSLATSCLRAATSALIAGCF